MIITDQTEYTGPLIHQRFAYRYFREKIMPTGNIVAFVAPTNVDTGLIDLEDALSNDFIRSEKMINLCWEIPNMGDGIGGVAFQRLFNSGLANLLSKYVEGPIMVDGDDIMVQDGEKLGKASVSITYTTGGVALGHTGINIVAGKDAPDFAYSTNMTEEQSTEFMNDAMGLFYWMTRDMFVATTKISVPK